MTTMQETSAISRFDLYSRGMHALHDVLGTVDAEEFISLVKSDRFDYTEWQRQHFDQQTSEQISAEAETYVKEHPYAGNPSTII